jgi:hypothetical protein
VCVELFPNGHPPADVVTGNSTVSSFQLFHTDPSEYPTNCEALELSAEVVQGSPVFHINTFALGNGVQRPFQIRVNGQLALNFADLVAVRFAIPPMLPNYTLATRPTGVPTGTIIFVNDAADGAKFEGWDGAKWVPIG